MNFNESIASPAKQTKGWLEASADRRPVQQQELPRGLDEGILEFVFQYNESVDLHETSSINKKWRPSPTALKKGINYWPQVVYCKVHNYIM